MKPLRRISTHRTTSADLSLARTSSLNAVLHGGDEEDRHKTADVRDDIFFEGPADPDVLSKWDSGSPSAAWYDTHFNKKRKPGFRRSCSLSLAPVDVIILLLSVFLLILIQEQDAQRDCSVGVADLAFFRRELYRCKADAKSLKKALRDKTAKSSLGACSAPALAVLQYLNFTPGQLCPGAGTPRAASLVESLVFEHHCNSIPRRSCLPMPPRGAASAREPLPFPRCLWEVPESMGLAWEEYSTGGCRAFSCLQEAALRAQSSPMLAEEGGKPHVPLEGGVNAGMEGSGGATWDGLVQHHLFSMELETETPRTHALSPSVSSVLALEDPGAFRVGLDILGGTGNFAAEMAERGITVVTTGQNRGWPVLQTLALRGLPSLHLPFDGHLPFFDGALDLIHCSHWPRDIIKEASKFEPILFEWDRVLQPGGIVWLDKLPCSSPLVVLLDELATVLEYSRRMWHVEISTGVNGMTAGHVGLCFAVLQKPLRRGSSLQA